MTLDEYQNHAMRTRNPEKPKELLVAGVLGLNGEAGEVAEIVKKHFFHDHPLDVDKIKEELGDVLWYIALTAYTLDLTLDEVAAFNVHKLLRRYPAGFDRERSLNREL